MRIWIATLLAAVGFFCADTPALAQAYGLPDKGQPGDEMIQKYLRLETDKLHSRFLQDIGSADDWTAVRPRLEQEYLYMLGLWPLPPKTPLYATVTRSLGRDGYVVDMLHYQSRPQLYVTGNLYRPSDVRPGQRLPAVLYVCGHSSRGRNGNKAAFQSHGIWFARHGYICLVIDTLQLGEIAAVHHGTSREGRWWWHSRGYTSAGVECWNGVRGIDYLVSRPDVDPERIAVTGISGGGAATFWIASADPRVRVAVPVSGMADLPSYITNRVIKGHCDCMFLYNTFRWPWTRIAALIAPRPMLFVNSDQDRIFPMDANERIINRLERLYSLFGAGDRVDSVVSIGGHAYRQDIRQAAYRFMNTHLKNDPKWVGDSELDLITGPRRSQRHPIEPERLRVFPKDSDIPDDERNTTIDRHFVALAHVKLPGPGSFQDWKKGLLHELRRVSFGYFPEHIPPATLLEPQSPQGERMGSENAIEFRLRRLSKNLPKTVRRILLVVSAPGSTAEQTAWLSKLAQPGDLVYECDPRGVGKTLWTRNNPPNYVERAHALLGRTVDTGRVWDVIAAARYLQAKSGNKLSVHLAGKGPAGIVAAYAALLEPDIAAVTLIDPPSSHMDPAAPQFLNALRVCDIPEVLGMLAPRPLTILRQTPWQGLDKIAAIYKAAGAPEAFAAR